MMEILTPGRPTLPRSSGRVIADCAQQQATVVVSAARWPEKNGGYLAFNEMMVSKEKKLGRGGRLLTMC
jgi:hypothetical protein